MNKKIVYAIITAMVIMLGVIFGFKETGKIDKEKVHEAVDIVADAIETYSMTEEEVKDLPTTEIEEQTEEQENAIEQEVESEAFELQGQIAYEGDRARSWNEKEGCFIGWERKRGLLTQFNEYILGNTENSFRTNTIEIIPNIKYIIM